MSGFYSYALEKRITFDATPISLAGSTADWTPVQTGDNQDANDDSQSGGNETDLVGNAEHSLLYAKFDTNGTDTESDDEIGFRIRVGAIDGSGGFGAIGLIGTDANNDGVVDLFLAYDGRTTPTVTFFEPGSGTNDSPASTSLQNAVLAAGAETNVSLVDATTDPSATDTDLDDDGNSDAFVSFKFLFSSFKDQMDSVASISLSKDSALQFATFTLTQENAIDGDIGGINGGNDSTETFADLGIFSKAVAPIDLAGATPTPSPAADPIITSNGGGSGAIVQVAENTTAVTTVTASDSDGDSLSFSIVGGTDQDRFDIDNASGELTFKIAPNFENPTSASGDNNYLVFVQANDGQGGSDTQALLVTVTNVNEPPAISSDGGGDSATIDVVENTTSATTVAANDVDGDTVTFSISGGADATHFDIDPISGALSFIAAPDFENPNDADGNNEYIVAVQASDGGGGTDSQAITVRVTNANEAPVITSNGGAPAAVNVAENATAVTTVQADDVDGNPIAFSITGGADAALFQIDAGTGLLTFNTAPDFETATDADGDNDYVVTVQASDGRGLIDTQTITVTVANIDETGTVADGADPVIPPDTPTTVGQDAGGGTGPGVDSNSGDSSGTSLITGINGDAPAPPAVDLSPPPEATAEAPTEQSTEQPAETSGENLSEAAAEALAEAAAASLANIATAAGPGSDATSVDTDTAREQTASLETQQRDALESSQARSEQGPTLILDAGVPDTLFEADSSFTFRLPDNVFTIVGDDAGAGLLSDLILEASLADGSPLPDWLIFDPELNEFHGAPPNGEEMTFEVRITATDLLGNEASATFMMIVEPSETKRTDGAPGGNQQSSTESSETTNDVLTATAEGAENGVSIGQEPQSTDEIALSSPPDIPGKASLTGQIKETGFGKFQADALRLALGRSG